MGLGCDVICYLSGEQHGTFVNVIVKGDDI